jgi:AMMECR1 domain-containing protein
MDAALRKTYVNSISQNVRGLIVSGRRMSGLHYPQISKQNEQKEREKIIQPDQPA